MGALSGEASRESVGGMTTPMLHFHTHLAPSDHARLQRFSKRKGQSAAEYLRRALKRQLDEDDLEHGALPASAPGAGSPNAMPAARAASGGEV
jgi:hypothetical protein